MKPIYPRNIHMFTYETLVRHPLETFARVLEIFGHDTQAPAHQEKMALALRLSSRESVKEIERSLGHSLARDQVRADESHVRDGAIGKWKRYFNDQDLKEVQRRLGDFGICLDEFQFE